VSKENNKENETQEQELWDRISTTEGTERAEVLDELSHIAYQRDDYIECLQILDTAIDIYFELGRDSYTRELIHLYEHRAFTFRRLNRYADSAATFEEIAKLHEKDDDPRGHICAIRAAACDWYEVKNWQKCYEDHCAARDAIDIDANPTSMGIDLGNIGMAQARLDQHEEAIVNFLSARKLFKKAKEPEKVNWMDNFLSISYAVLGNGPESKFHAKHFFNFSKVVENLSMEGQARSQLGTALLLCQEYDEASKHFERSLELLTLDDDKDWPVIIETNKQFAKVLFALNIDEEANNLLERIATLEETFSDDEETA
jgi:tetratricopeptide (TPR) repeat protein